MGFKDVIDQEQAKEFLKSSIASDRVSSGYLFHGPRGVGKAKLAIAFAQALNCENNDPDGCGECPACRRIARFVHPDVTFIFPTSAKNEYEEIVATHKARSENELFIHAFPAAATIKIKTIQDLRMDLAVGVREGRRRVVILAYAERMTPEASNCLLRTLEEPKPGVSNPRVTFVLTATSRNELLPTIVSRCQAVHLVPLPALEIQRVLMERKDKLDRKDMTVAEAAILARLSGGSLSAAVEFAEQDIVKYREANLEYLRSLGSRTPAEILAGAEALAEGNDRNQVRIFVHLALLWLRDLLLLRCNGREGDVAHADLADELRREAEGIELTEIRRRIDILEEIIFSMERNVDMSLLLSASFLRLAGVVKGNGPLAGDWRQSDA
jgi:DNA polymerase-3 subunit delta'